MARHTTVGVDVHDDPPAHIRRGALRAPAPICLLYQREDDILPYNKLVLNRLGDIMATLLVANWIFRGACHTPRKIISSNLLEQFARS